MTKRIRNSLASALVCSLNFHEPNELECSAKEKKIKNVNKCKCLVDWNISSNSFFSLSRKQFRRFQFTNRSGSKFSLKKKHNKLLRRCWSIRFHTQKISQIPFDWDEALDARVITATFYWIREGVATTRPKCKRVKAINIIKICACQTINFQGFLQKQKLSRLALTKIYFW